MKRILILFAFLGVQAGAQNYGLHEQIINVDSRTTICLDGEWHYLVDPVRTGYEGNDGAPMAERNTFFADKNFFADRRNLIQYDFDSAKTISVPGDWNTQYPELYYYEGSIWYNRKFSTQVDSSKRYFLYVGAANYESVIGFNGHIVGRHVGGFTPFNIELTGKVVDSSAGSNSLILNVDNTRDYDGVPSAKYDWWNYGGITRSVYLIETPQTFIRDYSVQLDRESIDAATKTISGWIQLDGNRKSQKVRLLIPELKVKETVMTDSAGYACFQFKAKPELWSPQNPKLYQVTFEAETDSVSDRIGFRSITTQGRKLLLNGGEIFCRGICLHEESPDPQCGRSNTREEARTTLEWAKELGCNFLRLAHYPHNESFIRAAEEMGFMLWSEIPVYWAIQFDNPSTLLNAQSQLEEMITRDRNRANVVIWSVANETPQGDTRMKFLGSLIDKTREMDPYRLVCAAMQVKVLANDNWTCGDPLENLCDLISFNQYIGWYDGDQDYCDYVTWSFETDKPVFISEFGGGAKYGNYGDKSDKFSEDYLEYLYQKNLKMISGIPGLVGICPWVLKDFRSPKRLLPTVQDEYNRKGLLSEKGEKKKAWYVLRDWYDYISSE